MPAFILCRLQYEQDMVVNLKHEKEKLDEVFTHEEKQVDKLTLILDIVKR